METEDKLIKIKEWLKETEDKHENSSIYRGVAAAYDLVEKKKVLFITTIVLKEVLKVLEE